MTMPCIMADSFLSRFQGPRRPVSGTPGPFPAARCRPSRCQENLNVSWPARAGSPSGRVSSAAAAGVSVRPSAASNRFPAASIPVHGAAGGEEEPGSLKPDGADRVQVPAAGSVT